MLGPSPRHASLIDSCLAITGQHRVLDKSGAIHLCVAKRPAIAVSRAWPRKSTACSTRAKTPASQFVVPNPSETRWSEQNGVRQLPLRSRNSHRPTTMPWAIMSRATQASLIVAAPSLPSRSNGAANCWMSRNSPMRVPPLAPSCAWTLSKRKPGRSNRNRSGNAVACSRCTVTVAWLQRHSGWVIWSSGLCQASLHWRHSRSWAPRPARLCAPPAARRGALDLAAHQTHVPTAGHSGYVPLGMFEHHECVNRTLCISFMSFNQVVLLRLSVSLFGR